MPIDTSSYADPGVNKLLATAGNDPTTALQQMGAAQQLGMNQQVMAIRAAQLSQSQLDLAKDKLGAMNNVLGGIIANPTMDNAQQRISDAVSAGVIDAPTAKAGLAQLMQTGGDPNNIRAWGTDHLNQNANHQQLMDQAYGAPSTVNTGGTIQPIIQKQGAQAGTYAGGGSAIPNTLAPGQKTGQVNYVDPSSGAGLSTSVGQLYDAQGNFKSIPVTRGGGQPASAGQGGDGTTPQAAPISFGSSSAAAPQGGGSAPQGAQGGQASGTVTPNPQTLPVISPDDAKAALARIQGGQSNAADRNILRGYAVQNNQPLGKLGAFEPQPVGVGAGISVPPQPQQQGQDGATAASVPPGRQPPQATGASAPPAGMAVQPGSDSSHLVRTAPAAAPSPAGQGGVLTTSLSPGQQASITAGAGTYQGLQADVANPNGSPQRVFNLTQALDATRGTNTGRGTAFRQDMLGTLDALPGGLGKIFPGVDPTSLTNYDLATKYTNAIAMGASGASRSDQAQALASSANANTGGMTQGAAQHVILNQIGQERAKQGLVAAFNATGQDPGNFAKFATTWGQGVNPQAFALGSMTPQERAAMVSSLQGPAKAAFLGSVRKGLQSGVLTPSDLQGASNAQ